jgi:hypothetical protein
MPVYEVAKAETNDLVKTVLEKYHKDLHDAGATVQVLMALPASNENGESQGPPLKMRGYPVVARIKSTSLRDRVAGLADILIEIDDDRWKQFKKNERIALLDHELYHLIPKRDKDNAIVEDDHGRPKLRSRPHDREIGWFDEVTKRHGKDSLEWQAFNSLWHHCRQLDLPFLESIG